MDKEQLDRAFAELNWAHQSMDDLISAVHFSDVERNWAAFLMFHNRSFDRLEKAAGKGEAWFGRVAVTRKADALLRYLHHARNADVHGLVQITTQKPGFIYPVEFREHPAGSKTGIVTFEMQDPHIALADAVDCGITYPVPREFEGEPISTPTPTMVGLLGLSWLERTLHEAKAKLEKLKK